MSFERLEDRVLLAVSVLNLEIASDGFTDGNWSPDNAYLAFLVPESLQGADLNDDGDQDDSIVHVWSAATNQIDNTGLDGTLGFAWSADSAHLAILVNEFEQGEDLNGDTDILDNVVHVWEAATGSVTNLMLDGSQGYTWSPDGAHLAIRVSEFSQGSDLNGDEDQSDRVMHIWKAATGATTNLMLDAGIGTEGYAWSSDGAHLAILVDEVSQGTDLNGNVVLFGSVMHVWDATTGTTTNLAINAWWNYAWSPDGAHLAFGVDEYYEGGTDLNGDGDSGFGDHSDLVLHVWSAATGTVTNLMRDSSGGFTWSPDGARLAFLVNEYNQGFTDLNGDGGSGNQTTVLHVWDAAAGTVSNLMLIASQGYAWSPDGAHLAVRVDETGQGQGDLNGDGDTTDIVMYAWSAATDTVTNLMLDGGQGYSWSSDGALLAVLVSEERQGNTDLNDDADLNDYVVFVWSAATGLSTNLMVDGLGGFTWSPHGAQLAIRVAENSMGHDLNGDEDAADLVMHVWSATTGLVDNLMLNDYYGHSVWSADGAYLLVPVLEELQGGADLDDDGDAHDYVLHLWNAATGDITNLMLDGSAGFAWSPTGARLAVRDANGLGDFMYVWEAATNEIINLMLDANNASFAGIPFAWSPDGNRLAVNVHEGAINAGGEGATDLNNDGDTSDAVLHVVTFSPETNAPPVAANDTFTTNENAPLSGNLFADNGHGADSDPDEDAYTVANVNGNTLDVGQQITLTSGALLTVNANGTFTYNPNGKFEAVNFGQSATDSFTYTIRDPDGLESTATVTITIQGVNDGFTYTGTTVSVTGTNSDDTVFVDLAARTVTVNGAVHQLSPNITQVTLNGLDGYDRLFLLGTTGDEAVRLLPLRGVLESSPLGITGVAHSFELMHFDGRGGNDLATLIDSAGNDIFYSRPEMGRMVGSGFENRAVAVSNVVAIASAGGTDRAYLYDSEGDDVFLSTSNQAYMSGTGTSARQFEEVVALADYGGFDRATLQGTAGDDLFVASGTLARMNGAAASATRFEVVTGLAYPGGNDRAVITGTAGNDVMRTQSTLTSVVLAGGGILQATQFAEVVVYGAGGRDVAHFTGSAGIDLLVAGPTRTVLSGDNYRSVANNFAVIHATASGAGDIARLQDSAGNDIFTGENNLARLVNDESVCNAMSFGEVTILGTTGLNRRKLQQPLLYTLIEKGPWV